MLGTIGWTGNFQFTFEVDNVGQSTALSPPSTRTHLIMN